MQHLGFFMHFPTNSMTAILTHNSVAMLFGMLLNGVAHIPERGNGLDRMYTCHRAS